MAEVVTVLLNNGARMPVIGLGLAAEDIMTSKGSAPVDHIKSSILAAIQVGYRTFDTAAAYFTEGILGESLKDSIEKGMVSREDVFVTSKLYVGDSYPQDVIPALRKSLEALKLEYLDLYLIHFPVALRKGVAYPHITPDDVVALDIQGVWRAMEECVELGLTKAIGVSNFSSKKISDLLAFSKISPAVNQCGSGSGNRSALDVRVLSDDAAVQDADEETDDGDKIMRRPVAFVFACWPCFGVHSFLGTSSGFGGLGVYEGRGDGVGDLGEVIGVDDVDRGKGPGYGYPVFLAIMFIVFVAFV
ncbi:hypothetical protein SUGI_0710170 [Cryptomeria japonica]|nr:hypothetical protein SUGI_0710170 [Cryptomeria japonica]